MRFCLKVNCLLSLNRLRRLNRVNPLCAKNKMICFHRENTCIPSIRNLVFETLFCGPLR